MAALITRLHDVVQGFIEKPRRGTINLDKDTRTTIGSEVLQLSRAEVKRHTLGGDSRFRYHVAQPYRMLSREFLHWNKLALRRMKFSSKLKSPFVTPGNILPHVTTTSVQNHSFPRKSCCFIVPPCYL